jgi:hypothetical protein
MTLFVVGLLGLALGAYRFATRGGLSLGDFLHCLIAIPLAWLLLIVFDYVYRHSRLALVMVVVPAALFVFNSPALSVGLGIVLLGVAAARRTG